ncbi:hypothetical protein [Rhizobium sp. Nf11,1]|uniref:hypothetical protein n=1 Tax=Rhizobium sp. Nf11,1 TaxID=3404923 RepID=UPI003D33A4C4
MSSPADVQRLAQIRSRHADASIDWSLSADGKAIFARVVPGTAPVAIIETTGDCDWPDRDFLIGAHADIEFLLRLLNDAFSEIRRLKPRHNPHPVERQAKPKDYAAECAMKCNDRLFRRWLTECHNVPDVDDPERIVVSVRSILRIKSRGELNTDPAAQARWLDFRASFEAWRAHP